MTPTIRSLAVEVIETQHQANTFGNPAAEALLPELEDMLEYYLLEQIAASGADVEALIFNTLLDAHDRTDYQYLLLG